MATQREMIRDIRASRSAQRDYLHRATVLRVEARLHDQVGLTTRARRARAAAVCLEQAALAEFRDPEPGDR